MSRQSITVHTAHQRAPMADAIVQTGGGFRMMQPVDTVEGQIGEPFTVSDFALHRAMLKHLGLSAAACYGSLFTSL